MSQELLALYQEGSAQQIGEWIKRSVEAYSRSHQGAEIQRLTYWPAAGTYPTSDDEEDQCYNLGPHQSIAISFTLGYCSGLIQDAAMAHTYEVLYRTLESMHFHYKLQYGLVYHEGIAPYFVVKTPGEPGAHLQVAVTRADGSVKMS